MTNLFQNNSKRIFIIHLTLLQLFSSKKIFFLFANFSLKSKTTFPIQIFSWQQQNVPPISTPQSPKGILFQHSKTSKNTFSNLIFNKRKKEKSSNFFSFKKSFIFHSKTKKTAKRLIQTWTNPLNKKQMQNANQHICCLPNQQQNKHLKKQIEIVADVIIKSGRVCR